MMAREQKHTPGPWEAGWGNGITGPRAADALGWEQKWPVRHAGFLGDHLVCAIPYSMADAERVEADARLIAAAPEMLAALEAIKRDLLTSDHPEADRVCDAIAKARGEAA